MLTRLKVSGFKNLVNVDVSFGPFTGIAGVNGVGKSNLFDAIMFLSALADWPLMDAARCIRDEENRSTELASLFFNAGDSLGDEMSFEAEMLILPEGTDDLGQQAKATITFLRYGLVLGYRRADGHHSEQLVVRKEELKHINVGDARRELGFDHKPEWRHSVVQGARRSSPPPTRRRRRRKRPRRGSFSCIRTAGRAGPGSTWRRRSRGPSCPRQTPSKARRRCWPAAKCSPGVSCNWSLFH